MSTDTVPILKLKRGEDRRLRAGHLWVFSNEIDTKATPLTGFARGAVVRVHTDRDEFVGLAYVNPNTLIAARIIARDPALSFDGGLLQQRIERALRLRESLYEQPYYRLIFGESDRLPGLIVDRYGDLLVAQSATAGMDVVRADIERALAAVLGEHRLVWKNDSGARDLEGLPRVVQVAGEGTMPRDVIVKENGATFTAPLAEGQKTGWFYDQARNREQLRYFLPQGARVLDVCSYVGAWAVSALKAGASDVLCIDSSGQALAYAERNAMTNDVRLRSRREDAFDALRALVTEGARFDVVILDPPAFIKRRKDAPQGQAAYRKLNQLALSLIDDGGLLVSCSCSYHLSVEELLQAVQGGARQSGRFVQVLAHGGQAPDHPLHPAILETRYLKALFCRVTHD
ncbi:MAG TPA: class I SAM-dependent rRNA methyltransferase [Steroidobacteraceae bacterium]|nr:class I SAM-dependent rRNA methyltransferase [Steroidobacteraceae bacterium]HRX89065.1 class I SAM-dependent rRNA methyltransferase [Steroidobacteraceae bacterium]